MPKFAANLTTMFTELPLQDRFDAARQAGFHAAELLRPYDTSIEVQRAELELILINTPMGDVAAGERGLAGVPGREDEFQDHFAQALHYAAGLAVPMIHVMAGVVAPDCPLAEAEATLVANLQSVAPTAADVGVRLLLEPLNTQDVPAYLHTEATHTVELLKRIAADNVQLQYDFYHQQISTGNLGATVTRLLPWIGHVQFSSVPGRAEPQHGEVNLPFLFDLLDEIGYDGWVGCEYSPKTTTVEGLHWYAPYRS